MGVFRTHQAVDCRAPISRTAPIGGVRKRLDATLTTFRDDPAKGGWVFGDEVETEFRLETRTFRRRNGGRLRTVDFLRYEIVIPLRQANRAGIAAGDTVILADMPLAQRRVRMMRLQKYAEKIDTVVFEDLTSLPQPFDDPERRQEFSDEEAIRVLHSLPINLFSSERAYSACLAGTEAGTFAGYDDAEDPVFADGIYRDAITGTVVPAIHDDIAARTRAGGTYAFGVTRDVEKIRQAMFMDPKLSKTLDQAAEGGIIEIGGRGKGGRFRVPLELGARAFDHLSLAVHQALAGPGSRTDQWTGKPVAFYVENLLHAHLKRAAERLQQHLVPTLNLPDVVADKVAQVDLEAGQGWEGSQIWAFADLPFDEA